MSTTTLKTRSLQQVADESNPNQIEDALRQMKLGTLVTPIKRTFTGLTGAASYDLTALDGTGEAAGVNNPLRLAVLACLTLRVTAATTANTVGTYQLSDIAGTLTSPTASTVVGIARISDDGKSLSFITADVTAFVIEYIPRINSLAQMQAGFTPNS